MLWLCQKWGGSINVNHKSPCFEVPTPKPGRGSQMRSMKRLELPNNAATGASAALLTSRDKASKFGTRQESFSYVRCGLGYLWSNKKTFFRDQHIMNKPVVLMVTMNHHFHWDDWMIWGSPHIYGKKWSHVACQCCFWSCSSSHFWSRWCPVSFTASEEIGEDWWYLALVLSWSSVV